MATIDPDSNDVVIRVVYDGPAMSGKTTSVRSLALSLGGNVIVPEDIDGRTVLFDWLDYTGGLFEGRSIRCQIISVPGQASLAARRKHLLDSADVVIFVGDSTRDSQDTVRRYLKTLDYIVTAKQGPRVGIVLQANKRDHVDATPLADIQRMLDDNHLQMAIIESVATESTGIRETFVFAVRLALDRVRELIRQDMLPTARPHVDNADELLESLRVMEGGVLHPLPDSTLVHTRLSDVSGPAPETLDAELRRTTRETELPHIRPVHVVATDADVAPALPTSALAGGLIWPPVEGRIMLHQIMQHPKSIVRTQRGNWIGNSTHPWVIQSPARGSFDVLDQGRKALLNWARIHGASARVLSRHRCVALAPDGQGSHRLWQFVRREESLLDRFRGVLPEGPESVAKFLIELQKLHVLAVQSWSAAGCRIPLGMASMTTSINGPCYAGPMPFPAATKPGGVGRGLSTLDWMLRELQFAKAPLKKMASQVLASSEVVIGQDVDKAAQLEGLRRFFAALDSGNRPVHPLDRLAEY